MAWDSHILVGTLTENPAYSKITNQLHSSTFGFLTYNIVNHIHERNSVQNLFFMEIYNNEVVGHKIYVNLIMSRITFEDC